MSLKPCDNYKERIERYSCNELNQHEIEIMLEHIRQCDGCRQYLDALNRQEQKMAQWIDSLEPFIQAGQAQAVQQFRLMQSQTQRVAGISSRFWWMRYAAAACILIIAGFLAGRLSHPELDTANLRRELVASLRPQMETQITESVLQSLRPDIVGEYARMQDNLSKQIASELKTYAEQTIVRNDVQTYRLLAELIDAIQKAQSQNQQWVLSAMGKLEQCRLEDQEKMRTQFATFAIYTDNELTRTQEQLKALATNTKN